MKFLFGSKAFEGYEKVSYRIRAFVIDGHVMGKVPEKILQGETSMWWFLPLNRFPNLKP